MMAHEKRNRNGSWPDYSVFKMESRVLETEVEEQNFQGIWKSYFKAAAKLKI